MELVIGGLIAFAVELVVLGLVLAPRWMMRTLRRPFGAIAGAARGSHRGRRSLVAEANVTTTGWRGERLRA
jgi:hypothetical protein